MDAAPELDGTPRPRRIAGNHLDQNRKSNYDDLYTRRRRGIGVVVEDESRGAVGIGGVRLALGAVGDEYRVDVRVLELLARHGAVFGHAGGLVDGA